MKSAAPAAALDASAVVLSGLCLIHCLALPILAAALPLAGVIAEAEWIHRVFVLTAALISGVAIFKNHAAKGGLAFPILAIAGLSILFAAAFAEPLHDYEVALTSLGAVILASAHVWRWARHNQVNPTRGPTRGPNS